MTIVYVPNPESIINKGIAGKAPDWFQKTVNKIGPSKGRIPVALILRYGYVLAHKLWYNKSLFSGIIAVSGGVIYNGLQSTEQGGDVPLSNRQARGHLVKSSSKRKYNSSNKSRNRHCCC